MSVFSSIQSLPACQVFRLSHVDSTADGVVAVPVGWLLAPTGEFVVVMILAKNTLSLLAFTCTLFDLYSRVLFPDPVVLNFSD